MKKKLYTQPTMDVIPMKAVSCLNPGSDPNPSALFFETEDVTLPDSITDGVFL